MSILFTIKKMLGITNDYDHFDTDIMININMALLTLNQIGVGPEEGYAVHGEGDLWVDYLGDSVKLEAVKTFIYLKVRLAFDPPANSFLIAAMKDQISELEWRLNAQAEGGK